MIKGNNRKTSFFTTSLMSWFWYPPLPRLCLPTVFPPRSFNRTALQSLDGLEGLAGCKALTELTLSLGAAERWAWAAAKKKYRPTYSKEAVAGQK
jgi:hypothetical protein